MARFDVQRNFETGDATGWTSESDSGNQITYPSYRELAALPQKVAPFFGAYVMKQVLGAVTTAATVTDTGITMGDDEDGSFQFSINVLDDFTASVTDDLQIFAALQSTTNVITVGLRITSADVVTIGIDDTVAALATAQQSQALDRNVWYTISVTYKIDETANGDGTIDLFVTREGDLPTTTAVAVAASLTQAHPDSGVLGTSASASTTTGTILFDQFVQSTTTVTRMYPRRHRWAKQQRVTQNGHVCVGAGKIDKITFTSVTDADELQVFDTNSGDTNDETNIIAQAKIQGGNETIYIPGPIRFRNGAFLKFSAAAPEDSEAIVDIGHAAGYGSDGLVRTHGLRSKAG